MTHDPSPYRTSQLTPELPDRPAHIRILITGTMFCDHCHQGLTAAQLPEHQHLPRPSDTDEPLPFDGWADQ